MDHADSFRLTRAGGSALRTLPSTPAVSAPPVLRGSMVPQPWTGLRRSIAQGIMQSVTRLTHTGPVAGFSAKAASATRPAATAATAPAGSWQQAAGQRRNVLLCLIALTAFAAAVLLANSRANISTWITRSRGWSSIGCA